MRKLWEDDAWEEYKEWLNVDKKILKRINEEHRLIYKVQGNIIIIVSCKGHYVKERK